MSDPHSHPIIYLQPWCDACDKASAGSDYGRLWCQDDVWGECDGLPGCERKPETFVRAGLVSGLVNDVRCLLTAVAGGATIAPEGRYFRDVAVSLDALEQALDGKPHHD